MLGTSSDALWIPITPPLRHFYSGHVDLGANAGSSRGHGLRCERPVRKCADCHSDKLSRELSLLCAAVTDMYEGFKSFESLAFFHRDLLVGLSGDVLIIAMISKSQDE